MIFMFKIISIMIMEIIIQEMLALLIFKLIVYQNISLIKVRIKTNNNSKNAAFVGIIFKMDNI